MIDPNTTIGFIIFDFLLFLIVMFHLFYAGAYESFVRKRTLSDRHADMISYVSYLLIPIVMFLIIYFFIDIGIYNGVRNSYIFATILFLAVYDFIAFVITKKNTRKQIMKITISLGLIWVLLVLSIGVNSGSIFSPMDHKRQWDSTNNSFEFDNESYNASIQLATSTGNLKGYFVYEPLSLSLYDGKIVFQNKSPPENESITVQVELFPHAYYASNSSYVRYLTRLETSKVNDKTYEIKMPNEYRILYYDMSGQKYISGDLYIGDSLVCQSEKVPYLELEKGYVKAQVEMSRAITILTLWLVFIGLLPHINPFFDWLEKTFPERFKDKKQKRLENWEK